LDGKPVAGGAERPTEMGDSDVDDYCNVLARMSGGVSATFHFSRYAYGRGNFQRMEVYGDGGSLVYKLDETPGMNELEICIGEPMGSLHAFANVPVPQSYASDQLQSFADVVNGVGDGLAATMADGLANQRLLDAILKSAATGRRVAIK